MIEEIKPGMVVVLKSGSPDMTVETVSPTESGPKAECVMYVRTGSTPVIPAELRKFEIACVALRQKR